MKKVMLSIGDFIFEDMPLNKGLIGGKIIATNKQTGETQSRIYQRLHTGKTNKISVLT